MGSPYSQHSAAAMLGLQLMWFVVGFQFKFLFHGTPTSHLQDYCSGKQVSQYRVTCQLGGSVSGSGCGGYGVRETVIT